MAFYGCDPELGSFNQDRCNVRNGRVRYVSLLNDVAWEAFFGASPTADPTDLADWNAFVASGDIKVIGATSGDYPKPSSTRSDGEGDQKSSLSSFQHVVNYMHRGLIENNRDFYNSLNKSSRWYIAFVVDAQTKSPIHYFSDSPLAWEATPPVEAGTETQVKWNVTGSWDSDDIPLMESVPAGLYN